MSGMTLEKAVSATIGLAAAVLAVSIGYRTIAPAHTVAAKDPVFVSFWRDALAAGINLGGNERAPVKMLVLSDLECPACRGYHKTVEDLLRVRQDIEVIYVSYPLKFHQYALPAAQVAECADRAGAFRRLVEVFYAKQDSLATKSWGSYAADAGIKDTASVASCAHDNKPYKRVSGGLSFAERVGNPGTPTVLLNGWQFPQPPGMDVLNRSIDALLKGKKLKGKAYAVPLGVREASSR